MRHFNVLIFLTTFLLTLWLVSSTPINPKRWLINRPTVPTRVSNQDEELARYRRFAGQGGVKGGHKPAPTRSELDFILRKGEYVCGNKICKLKVGEIPCPDHMCQYPI